MNPYKHVVFNSKENNSPRHVYIVINVSPSLCMYQAWTKSIFIAYNITLKVAIETTINLSLNINMVDELGLSTHTKCKSESQICGLSILIIWMFSRWLNENTIL
jgi:hypothetical protein